MFPTANIEDEKRKRKNQRFETINNTRTTPSTSIRRKSIAVEKDVINTQLRVHYSLCIQLSKSNKINSNNAFGLHLIDHMDTMIRSLKSGALNFKVASSTLDAGTKIYCSRVDSVHSEAQKVASALVNALDTQKSKNRAGASGDLGEDELNNDPNEAENDDEARSGQRQRKHKKKVKTVDTIENLTISKVDNTIEFDQIFLKINSAFDMATLDSLLLNNLQIDCSGQLIINSKSKWNEMQLGKVASANDREAEEASEEEWFAFEIDSLQDALKPDARICPLLDGFRFDNRMEALENEGESMFAFRDLPDDDVNENNSFGDYGIGGDIPDDMGGAADFDFGMQNTDMGDVHHLSRMGQQDFRNLNSHDLSQLMRALSEKPNEYTYFDRKLINTWAGPNFWKRRYINIAGGTKPTSTTAKKAKKTFEKIVFNEYIDDVVFVSKESRKLALPTFEKWMENKNQLPEFFSHTPVSFVKPFWKSDFTNLQLKGANVNKDSADAFSQTIDNQHSDNDDDNGNNFDGLDLNQSTNSNFEMMPTEEYDMNVDANQRFTGDNLIEQPYEIEHIDIPYAKFAKKIDVKRLKGLIWDVVQHPPENSLNTSLIESQTPPPSVCFAFLLFYSLFSFKTWLIAIFTD